MTATTKKSLNELIEPMFKQQLDNLEIEEKIYNLKNKIIEPIPFGKVLAKLVEDKAVELGFVLNKEGLNNKTKATLSTIDKLPKSYMGMIRLAHNMGKEVYNNVDEFIPYLKQHWVGDFPAPLKVWGSNTWEYLVMMLLVENPKISTEELYDEISHLEKTTESGTKYLEKHRVQRYFEMATKWTAMFQIFNESLTKEQIENLLSE